MIVYCNIPVHGYALTNIVKFVTNPQVSRTVTIHHTKAIDFTNQNAKSEQGIHDAIKCYRTIFVSDSQLILKVLEY